MEVFSKIFVVSLLLAFVGIRAATIDTSHEYCSLSVQGGNATFSDCAPVRLVEGDTTSIAFNFTCGFCFEYSSSGHEVHLTAEMEDPSICKITNISYITEINDLNSSTFNGNVEMEGVFLGKTSLTIMLLFENGTVSHQVEPSRRVSVARKTTALDIAFMVTVAILVACNTIAYACAVDLKVIKEHLKKPFGILIGFICQYGFMPLAAYSLTKIFSLHEGLAFGLICYGSSPGGGSSNIWTILLEGDINLSIAMTFFSVLSSLGMTSLWVYVLGREFTSNIVVPFENIVMTLAAFSGTCILGLCLQRFSPRTAKLLKKVIKPMCVLIILFIATVGTYVNLYIFKLMNSWRVMVAAILISYVGYVLSLVLSLITRRSWKVTKTIIIETGIQNGGLAILMVRYSLPEPDGDLATVAPATALMTSPIPFMVCLLIQTLYRCNKGIPLRNDPDKTTESTPSTDSASNSKPFLSDESAGKTSDNDSNTATSNIDSPSDPNSELLTGASRHEDVPLDILKVEIPAKEAKEETQHD